MTPRLLLPLALSACADQTPAWALQHGTLDTLDGAIDGYQVWEVYRDKWTRKRGERHHLCAVVQTLEGEEVTTLPGCVGCARSFAVRTELLETDCAAAPGGLDGVTHFSFGPVPNELQADEPHPGATLGWYVSFDGEAVEPMGFAWNAALDEGEQPEQTGFVDGERFVFWPAWAWDLGQ